MSKRRHYRNWFNYDSHRLGASDAFWMMVFGGAVFVGFPLMFVALYKYAIPWLFSLG